VTPEEILSHLIAIPSVVGTPNREIVTWIADYLDRHGVEAVVLPGPEGDRSNLFAVIGPKDQPGLVLSGHMDVVPADGPGWESDPFALTARGDRLYGRGTSDMKGFLACALAVVPTLAAQPRRRPLCLAFSYDEEAGCRGVPHLLARLPELCAPPLGCVIGEPSGLRAVCSHKGKAAARVEITGRAGHSSRPDLGRNAIHAMGSVLAAAAGQAEALTAGPLAPTFEPPYSTLQVGTIQGGQAVNIIPDRCAADLEARAIPGVDPRDLLAPVETAVSTLETQGFQTDWRILSSYPALNLPEDAPLARLLRDQTGQAPQAAVSYGTEGGLYQAAGVDAIVCGPGDIGRTHKVNEYIERRELTACLALIQRLSHWLSETP